MEFHLMIEAAKADPQTQEEAVDKTVCLLTTEGVGKSDTSPMRFISTALLGRYQRVEAAAIALAAALVEDP